MGLRTALLPSHLVPGLRRGFTIDVTWEDLKFVRAHTRDFRRTALVTDNQWISWSAWISRVFANTELAVFPDLEAARAVLIQVHTHPYTVRAELVEARFKPPFLSPHRPSTSSG
ncbi:MAG: STAS/SEC14 domain-containing protein, partial [Azonexus sp.]|nr:STAS/SEC14 domain-containing protein [Azonexus sp.]